MKDLELGDLVMIANVPSSIVASSETLKTTGLKEGMGPALIVEILNQNRYACLYKNQVIILNKLFLKKYISENK